MGAGGWGGQGWVSREREGGDTCLRHRSRPCPGEGRRGDRCLTQTGHSCTHGHPTCPGQYYGLHPELAPPGWQGGPGVWCPAHVAWVHASSHACSQHWRVHSPDLVPATPSASQDTPWPGPGQGAQEEGPHSHLVQASLCWGSPFPLAPAPAHTCADHPPHPPCLPPVWTGPQPKGFPPCCQGPEKRSAGSQG